MVFWRITRHVDLLAGEAQITKARKYLFSSIPKFIFGYENGYRIMKADQISPNINRNNFEII